MAIQWISSEESLPSIYSSDGRRYGSKILVLLRLGVEAKEKCSSKCGGAAVFIVKVMDCVYEEPRFVKFSDINHNNIMNIHFYGCSDNHEVMHEDFAEYFIEEEKIEWNLEHIDKWAHIEGIRFND